MILCNIIPLPPIQCLVTFVCFIVDFCTYIYMQVLNRHRPKQYSRFTGVLSDLSQSIRLVRSVYYVHVCSVIVFIADSQQCLAISPSLCRSWCLPWDVGCIVSRLSVNTWARSSRSWSAYVMLMAACNWRRHICNRPVLLLIVVCESPRSGSRLSWTVFWYHLRLEQRTVYAPSHCFTVCCPNLVCDIVSI